MVNKTLPKLRPDYANAVAFVLIVMASYASWLVNAGNLDLANANLPLACALGGLYCLLGTVGFAQVQRRQNRRAYWIALYFLVQFALGFGASALLRGMNSITILLIPLAWQSVLVRSRVALFLIIPALCLGLLILYGFLRPDWADAWRMSATQIAAVIAAVLFGQLTVREQDARAEVARLAADLQYKNEELRAYAATAEEAAIAAERNRLAREIHDSLGHYLTASTMQVQSARAMLRNQGHTADLPDVIDALGKAEGLAQEALDDVRRSVNALRETSIAQRSLPRALAELCNVTNNGAGATISFYVTGARRPLTPQADLTLYRVAQEGLTNVHKHAGASTVQMRLSYAADCVRLTIQDDGVGMVNSNGVGKHRIVGTAENGTGFGLIGLRERIGLLRGTLHVGTGEDGGCLLEAEVPL